MIPTIIDILLYSRFENGKLIGIKGSYLVDLLRAGNMERETQANATLERFAKIANEQSSLTFSGYHITQNEDMFLIDQNFYISKI